MHTEADQGPRLTRRNLLGLYGRAGGALAYNFLPEKIRNLDFLSEPSPHFLTGINNGHHIDPSLFPPNTLIRVPLNRCAFDPLKSNDHYPEKKLDPFYLKGEKLKFLRSKGSNVVLVIEMMAEDSIERLREMYDYADNYLDLKKGDRIVLGNEHNDGRSYPPETYTEQVIFLHNLIKSTDQDIQIGLQAEAWTEKLDYFKTLIQCFKQKNQYPFDFVPLNYYGKPQGLPHLVSLYRESMRRFGINFQIMISEVGVRISENPENETRNYPNEIIATPEDQAQAVWKYLFFAKITGCESMHWFNGQDDHADKTPLKYGLVDYDGTPRQALEEFKKAQKMLDQVDKVFWNTDGNQYLFNFTSQGRQTEISWFCSPKESLGGPVRILTKKS
jgi:hypothetical protein